MSGQAETGHLPNNETTPAHGKLLAGNRPRNKIEATPLQEYLLPAYAHRNCM